MNGYLERPDQIALLIEQETGHPVGSWQLSYLLNDEIAVMAGVSATGNEWYYGDFVIVSRDEFLASLLIQNEGSIAGDLDTLTINQIGGLSMTNGAIFKQVMWNQVASWDAIKGHFYGWKFSRARGYVVQSKTLSSAVGWTNVGTVYTHSSGVLPIAISGAWAASSELRISITVTGITAGTLTLEFDSGVVGTITENGTYTFTYTTNGLDSALYLTPTGSFTGSFDNANLIIEKIDFL